MFTVKKERFSEKEERILDFWERQEIFRKSLENRKGSPFFSFYDGPPFATGLPHYGHLLAGTIKDVIPRYKTMKGYFVPRRFGWDCHGLPVENEIEKAKELSGAPEIEKFGIDKFNEECRSIVLRYTSQWRSTVSRMGRWVDFDHTYKTMDMSFMESVWWVFGELWKKGLVYQGFKVMPFSAKLGTPLSNFEANLNYQDVDDPSLSVLFPLREEENAYLLIWTTTPWTLTSNLAVIANGEIEYAKVLHKETGRLIYLAKSRLGAYFKSDDEFEVLETMKGDSLAGKRYFPPFEYFTKGENPNAFQVLLDDFVGEGDGTGLVHAAPAFGESDFFVCKREGINLACPVDQNGKFTDEIPEYAGMFVKDADKQIIQRLKSKGLVFQQGTIRHRYPFCWRSDSPLIYKAVKTWFVSVEELKERMLAANQKIYWVPEHIKEGRFGKWLENARDWAISRNRYWGTPIPVWQSDDGDSIVISSVEELERRTGKKISDLHRHFIDELTFEENGKVFRRIPEVFDCWFESGSMPYAQNHYPFENNEETLQAFPADFIAEGLDQTRGWFYTLTVLGAALFDTNAFKNVIVNGLILAEDGHKMSKRLKNYPEPMDVVQKYGADAIRLYLLSSPAVKGEDLRFSERGVENVVRQFLLPFWNAYIFLGTYANIYHWEPQAENCKVPKAAIDRWILSLLQKLIKEIEEAMDRYMLAQAVEPFLSFIDSLTNWYIRRSRPRFWSEEETKDRREAFETLYRVLLNLSKIAAPFIPFLSEEIYQNLRSVKDPESVHLHHFPIYDADLRNVRLEKEMDKVQIAVSLGHGLRKESKVKVRQPLSTAYVISADPETRECLEAQAPLIADELNVKAVVIEQEESKFVDYKIKPNFRTLGPKFGKMINQVRKKIESMRLEDLQRLQKEKRLTITVEGQDILLEEGDVQVQREAKEGIVAATEGDITIALDLALNEELLLEGLAREIVNKVNTQRKNENFDVTDRIVIRIDSTEKVRDCFAVHGDYIQGEVLATEVLFESCEGTEWDLNGEPAVICLKKTS
ncbi:MAG: isoleucine--tRNA ligase [Simkaniaceae bacterium]